MKLKSQKFGTRSFPSDYDVVRVATLNKCDLTGGNNKFYQIEAHVSKGNGKSQYRLYSRYGRVGAHGVEEERWPDQNRAALDEAFDSLKKEKTSKRKGYVEVQVAQTAVGSSVANQQVLSDDVKKDKITATDDRKVPTLQLAPATAKLVDRLFMEAGKAVRSQLSGTLSTTAKNPLGTLTLTQIKEGERILADVQALLAKSPSLVDTIDRRLLDLSNQFYSAIPQVMEKRPRPTQGKSAMDKWLKGMALNNAKILDDKQELLDLLGDVQGLVSGFATNDTAKRYQEIGCDYELLNKSDPSWKRVNDYVQSQRGSNHHWSCKVANIWRIGVAGQRKKHAPSMKEVGNIKPLFHGSGPQNILGICKHGLLMRPPGVYITGSMFGNGLYFADSASKSEQYSFGRFGGGSGRGTTYFMFVADVALGKIMKYRSAQTSLTKPPRGYNSVMGEKGASLYHNEYIIYSLNQHILQYLIEFSTSNRGYY